MVVLPLRELLVVVLPLRELLVVVLPLRALLGVGLPLRALLVAEELLLEAGRGVELRAVLSLWLRLPTLGLVAVEEPMEGVGTEGRVAPGVQVAAGMGAGAWGWRM